MTLWSSIVFSEQGGGKVVQKLKGRASAIVMIALVAAAPVVGMIALGAGVR